jgi:hypothetical protein
MCATIDTDKLQILNESSGMASGEGFELRVQRPDKATLNE